MSTIKIKNASQLAQFLKVLAEESVTTAQVDIDDERRRQKSAASAAKRDLGRFMQEEDAPGAAPAAAPAPEPPADLAADPTMAAPPKEKAAPAPAPTPGEEDPLEPSFDAMTRAILDLRSGKSVRDSAIETELEAYYDRLQDAERYAMIIFLRALSGIVTGKMTGAQAAEPGDEPHGITISRAGEEEAAPEAPPAEEPAAGASPPAAPAAPEEPPAPAGPIQVGSPVTEAFRERIRQLIRANK
jgi:hypothetical protein